MTPLLLGLAGPQLEPAERRLIERLQPAGYVLFSRNLVDARQTRELTDSLRALHPGLDPILAIDQEGGRVTRTAAFAPPLRAAPELAAHGDPNLIARAGAATATLLRLLGINLDLAPVLDLDHFPDRANALRGRSWGRDPQRVIDHAGMWNRWLRKRSLASCAKHFPAGGRAESDPHHELPVCHADREQLLAEDIIPYTALMPEIDAVMLAHIQFPRLDPELPASLSPAVVDGLLRRQLGFDRHLVLTDDLDMGAIADRFPEQRDIDLALAAGNDLAMICHRLERAETAASVAARRPLGERIDREQRLERFRDRLHAPLTWRDSIWTDTCNELKEIHAAVPSLPTLNTDSPVADY